MSEREHGEQTNVEGRDVQKPVFKLSYKIQTERVNRGRHYDKYLVLKIEVAKDSPGSEAEKKVFMQAVREMYSPELTEHRYGYLDEDSRDAVWDKAQERGEEVVAFLSNERFQQETLRVYSAMEKLRESIPPRLTMR